MNQDRDAAIGDLEQKARDAWGDPRTRWSPLAGDPPEKERAMAKIGKRTKRVKSLPARSLTSKQAKGVKGGGDLLPAVRTGGQVSLADGVHNSSSFKLQKG